MGVKIINRTYSNQFKPSSTTNWLLGNVGDWQRLTLECRFSVEKVFSPYDSLTLLDPNIMLLNSGENWKDLGFDVGMNITLSFDIIVSGLGSLPNTFNLTILSILDNEIEVENQNGTPLVSWGSISGTPLPPPPDGNATLVNLRIFADIQPQGIKLDYSHITNSNAPSGNLFSHIDGTKTGFVMEDTAEPSIFFVGMSPLDFTHKLNFKSGLSVEKATVQYLGKLGIGYNYSIDIIYMLSPFYDDINNFVNSIAPSAVLGTQALTDNFEVIGYPVYNNPNITIKNDPKETEQEGNTGWFDENFNQLPNAYTHTPVIYTNLSGAVVTALDYINPIIVSTTITGLPIPFSGLERFQYGFIWVSQTEEDYKQNNYPFHQNLKVSTGGQAATLTDVFPFGTFAPLRAGYSRDGISGLDAQDISFTQNGASVDVSITFVPSAGFSSFMETLSDQERTYALWVSIGDQAPDTNEGDRVRLLLDFSTLQTFVEPIGPYDGLSIDFLDHPQTETDTPILCGNSLFVEDDILAKIKFREETAAGPTVPEITAVQFGVLVERISDGFQYVLDASKKVDLTVYPDPTQYNFNEPRDFKYNIGNSKNFFKVLYDAPNDSGTEKGVLGYYGFKIRWEDWLARFPQAPSEFYNNLELNNGLNQDWYEYFNNSGFRMYFYVNVSAVLSGQNVVYQNLKQMTIRNYDSNTNITTTVKTYRVVGGVKGPLLSGGTDPIYGGPLGVIIDNEDIWLEIEYTLLSGTFAALPILYGVNCIEKDRGAGQFSFRQLSSIFPPEFDNPLKGIPSQTLSTLTLSGGNTILTVECLIEANKLTDATRYKLTGRVGCIP